MESVKLVQNKVHVEISNAERALKKLQDVHYNAYYINYKLNFLKNENKNITTKQMTLLSTKAGIHHTAIPVETKQG